MGKETKPKKRKGIFLCAIWGHGKGKKRSRLEADQKRIKEKRWQREKGGAAYASFRKGKIVGRRGSRQDIDTSRKRKRKKGLKQKP